jgi:hypothetical protein
MKIISPLLAGMVLVAGLLTGCQSPKAMSPRESAAMQSTRNKDVSLLRFIRPEHDDVKELVKKIATASGTGASLLEKFARDDPSINLDDIRLPPGEVATRDAIAATKKSELLSQSGGAFELTLLLTQTEALSYGWHLAEVTSKNEPLPERARALAGIGEDMKNLYHEVFVLMLSKAKSPATNPITVQPD